MIIDLKKLNDSAIIPTRGTADSAGSDLYSSEVVTIAPGATVKVHTGISVKIPSGYFGGIYARSGLATKQGLRPCNCVGVVDSDYIGEIIVALHNDSDQVREINEGDRIAQLIIQSYEAAEFNEVDTLEETERGSGGFGSTGE